MIHKHGMTHAHYILPYFISFCSQGQLNFHCKMFCVSVYHGYHIFSWFDLPPVAFCLPSISYFPPWLLATLLQSPYFYARLFPYHCKLTNIFYWKVTRALSGSIMIVHIFLFNSMHNFIYFASMYFYLFYPASRHSVWLLCDGSLSAPGSLRICNDPYTNLGEYELKLSQQHHQQQQ